MLHAARNRAGFFVFISIALLAFALPALADNVTVSGNVLFSSLDGSSLDHDGAANGTFSVSDGDLIVNGTINCNDDSGAGTSSACAMKVVVSGNIVVNAGGGFYAENRRGGGAGGDTTLQAGGNVIFMGPSGSLPGAVVSTTRLTGANPDGTDRAGKISITAGGTVTLQAGSLLAAGAIDGIATQIDVVGGGAVTADGNILVGPSNTVATATKYTGAIISGGASQMTGGSITIKSTGKGEPGVTIGSNAIIAAQGETPGAGKVTLEGCGIVVKGLVASLSRNGSGANVIVRSGTYVIIDGRDLGGSGTRNGMIRADATLQSATAFEASVYAPESIEIYGPTSGSLYVMNSSGGKTSKDAAGTINVMSTGSTVLASGNAFAAFGTNSGDQGGTVNVSAKGDINLATAKMNASGDYASTDSARKGGKINVRSFGGSVTWTNGVGDVRPVGSSAGVPAASQGTVTITYCTSNNIAGTTFPSNGAFVGPFPTLIQSCSPAAPSLPVGEYHPDCNDPPVAVNDAYTVAEGGTLNVAAPGVLGNDSDPDGDPITAVLVSGPANATSFTLNADGSFSYVHNGGETTTDSFTYRANDGSLNSNVATVTITITPVNDAPVANNDAYTVAEGGTLNLAVPGVLANDTDPDGPTASAVLVSGPANAASFTLNADGSFIYVHNGSETTSDSFTYKVSDGSLFSNVATVSITVTPVNDAPVANDDSYSTDEDTPLTVAAPGVLGNDTDVDSGSLSASLVSGPSHAASFTLNANGSFSYTPAANYNGSDSFTYSVSDGSLTDTATVTLTINAVNDAPVATADAYTVAEGGTLSVAAPGVLANDSDVDSASLSAVLVSGPANASSFTLNANGSFSYVHDGSETTSDSFTYKVNDGSLDSNVVTVTITITPVNDAPVANDDAYTVAEGGTLNVAAPGVLGNDTDAENDSLNAAVLVGPTHGSLVLNADGSFTYIHDGGETTSDSFTYRASDASLFSNIATVTITITPVNDAPVAVADAYSVNEGATLTIAAPGVLGNDTDVDNASLSAVLVSGPAHASSFTLNANGSFTYVHDGSETTSDSFTYKASDGTDFSNVVTVTLTVNPVNDAPVAANDSYSVAEGGTLTVPAPGVASNDSDAENSALSVTLVSGPAHASSFTLNIDGSFTYVHDGGETSSDSFTYKVSDGSLFSNVATVTIAISPVNDAPVAQNDGPYNVNLGASITIPAPGVLANDSDPDSSITAVLVSNPTKGTVTLNPDGSFTYTSTAGTGADSFTYKATDGTLDSNIATVSINVSAQPPVAANDSFSTVGNTELRVGTGASARPAVIVSGSVLDNDTDPDSPHSSLTVSSFSASSFAGGTVFVESDGNFNYLPPVGFTGNDSFTYVVSDEGGRTATGTVTITVANRVWYVDNSTGGGDGRSTLPFNALSNAQTASAAGDYIYVHRGTGTDTNQNSGIVLKANQKLIGEGVALVVPPYTLAAAGLTPTIGNNSGVAVTLASGDAVRGLNITSASTAISGSAVNGGTFEKLGIVSAADGIALSSASGAFSATDVSITAPLSGLSLNGGTPVFTAANLDVFTTTGAALFGNAGTLNISAGSDGSIISTTNGAAVDLSNMTLGISVLRVASSNGTHGIKLSNTTGSFAVTGSGVAGSGGTISNKSVRGLEATNATNVSLAYVNFTNASTTNGVTNSTCAGNLAAGTNTGCNAAIYLSGVTGASFSNVVVDGSAQIGINGNAVAGLTLTNTEVKNAGNEAFESGVLFQNLSGTVTISGSNIHDNAARQMHVVNLAGAVTMNVTSTTFANSATDQGVLLELRNSAAATVNVQTSTFSNALSNAFQLIGNNSASANVTVNGTSFTNQTAGVALIANNASLLTYNITNNTIKGSGLQGIFISTAAAGTGSATGTISGNMIGTSGVPGSACDINENCVGIQLRSFGATTVAATVTNNSIYQAAAGINASAGSGSNSLQLKASNNIIAEPNVNASNAILVVSGAATADTTSVCADIFSNTILGSWDPNGTATAIRVRNRFAGTNFRLPGYAGAGNDTSAIAAFLSAQNGGAAASATVGTNPFTGGAACVTP